MAVNKEAVAGVTKNPQQALNTTLSSLQKSIAQLNGLLVQGSQTPATAGASSRGNISSFANAATTAGNPFGLGTKSGKDMVTGGMFGGLMKSSASMTSMLRSGFAMLGAKRVKNESTSAVKSGSPETYWLGMKLDALRKDGKKKEGGGWWKGLLAALAMGIGGLFSKLMRLLNPLRLLSSLGRSLLPSLLGKRKKDTKDVSRDKRIAERKKAREKAAKERNAATKRGPARDARGRFTKAKKPSVLRKMISKTKSGLNSTGSGLKKLGPKVLRMLGPAGMMVAGLAGIGIAGAQGREWYNRDREKGKNTWGDDQTNVSMTALVGERKGNRGIADIGKSLFQTTGKIIARTMGGTVNALGDFMAKPSLAGVVNIGAGLVKDVVKNLTNPLKLIGDVGYGIIGGIFGQEAASNAKRFIEGKTMADMKSELKYWGDLLNDPAKLKASGFSEEEVKNKIKEYQQESVDLIKKGGFTGALGNMFVSAGTEMARGYVAIAKTLATMSDEEIQKTYGITRDEMKKAQTEVETDFIYKELREAQDDFNNALEEIMLDQGFTTVEEATEWMKKNQGLKYSIMQNNIRKEQSKISERQAEFAHKAQEELGTLYDQEWKQKLDGVKEEISQLEDQIDAEKDPRKKKALKNKLLQINKMKKEYEKLFDENDNVWHNYSDAIGDLDATDADYAKKKSALLNQYTNAAKMELVAREGQLAKMAKDDPRRVALEAKVAMLKDFIKGQEEEQNRMEVEKLKDRVARLLTGNILRDLGADAPKFMLDQSAEAQKIRASQVTAANAMVSAKTPEEKKAAEKLQRDANQKMIEFVAKSKGYYKTSEKVQEEIKKKTGVVGNVTLPNNMSVSVSNALLQVKDEDLIKTVADDSTKKALTRFANITSNMGVTVAAAKSRTQNQSNGAYTDSEIADFAALSSKLVEYSRFIDNAVASGDLDRNVGLTLQRRIGNRLRILRNQSGLNPQGDTYTNLSTTMTREGFDLTEMQLGPRDLVNDAIYRKGRLMKFQAGDLPLTFAGGQAFQGTKNDSVYYVDEKAQQQRHAPPPGYNGMTVSYRGAGNPDSRMITLLEGIQRGIDKMVEKIDKVQNTVVNNYGGQFGVDNVVNSLKVTVV